MTIVTASVNPELGRIKQLDSSVVISCFLHWCCNGTMLE